MMKKIVPLFAIIIALVVAGVFLLRGFYKTKTEPIKNEKPLDHLVVQAGWLVNGEFANICSAIVNGYYQAEGLDVELRPGGPTGASFIIATNAVAQDSDLDIAIDGDLVPLLRGVTKEDVNERLTTRAFAAFWNENPYGFIVRKDSGITSLKDFIKTKPDGTKYKIGVTADSVIQFAIAKYAGVPVESLNLVTVGYDATPFLTGEVDALAAYWTTQAYEVEKAGIPYLFLSTSEMPGFSQPSMVAIATDKTLREKKGQLVRWLRATIRGNEFVAQNLSAAAEQIRDPRCGGPNFDAIQEGWLIGKSVPLFDKQHIGWLDNEQILSFARAYYDLGQLPRMPEVGEIINHSILSEVYPE